MACVTACWLGAPDKGSGHAFVRCRRELQQRRGNKEEKMPTALELTRDGWKNYLDGARSRLVVPELTDDEKREREQLLRRVRTAADILKNQFGARRVLLFGSLAQPNWFKKDSDVDLAVEGLKSGKDYWEAWHLVEEIIADRLVDFIEIETAGESLRLAIQRYGSEL
jgi:predicted nucleotidyltransferase